MGANKMTKKKSNRLHKLAKVRQSVKDQIKKLQSELKKIETEIDSITEKDLTKLRRLSGKEYGLVTLDVDGMPYKHTVKKKVTWIQDIMRSKYKVYPHIIKATFSIDERQYRKLDSSMQKIFDPARIVEPGYIERKFII